MMKYIASWLTIIVLCAALALPVLAYPLGTDDTLPRVVDNAALLDVTDAQALEQRARAIAGKYHMDIVIVTENGLGGWDALDYADEFLDDGYGWRSEESSDGRTGDGILLLLDMENRDLVISTKGLGKKVFRDGVWEPMLDAIASPLGQGGYNTAFTMFLSAAESSLLNYANGTGEYESGGFKSGLFLFVAALGLVIALAVVLHMKKKHNTIRAAQSAGEYQRNFRLTERQDIFLYSNVKRVPIPQQPPHSGGRGGGGFGGGFSGGGTRVSSGGGSHGGGGRKF